MKVNIKINDISLLKYLENEINYINEYQILLDKQLNLVSTNHMQKNKKEIKKNYTRLSELVIILSFLESKK